MPNVSYADLLQRWQDLLDELGEHRPDLDLERAPLSSSLSELRELRSIQKGLVAARRRITERQEEVKAEGRRQATLLKYLLLWQRSAHAD